MHGDWMLIGTGEARWCRSPSTSSTATRPAWPTIPTSPPPGAACRTPDWVPPGSTSRPFTALLDLATMMAARRADRHGSLPPEEIAALLPKDMVASLAADTDRLNLEVLVTPAEGTPR